MQWLRSTIEMAELTKTTMKLKSSLHRRVNVEIISITVLHESVAEITSNEIK